MSLPEDLFVYGTLRRDVGYAMHRLLTRYARFEAYATVHGRLYDLGAYPALVLTDAPAARVTGELYRLHRPTRAEALAALDHYEGCTAPPPTEYRRVQHTVQLREGPSRVAWVYVYNRAVAGLPRIGSGDYAAHHTRRKGR